MPAISTLIDAIFATRCVLCKKLESACCDACWAALDFDPRQVVRLSGKELRGVAAIDFDPTVGQLIRAFKDSGHSALAPRFATAMAQPLLGFCSETGLDPNNHIHLVPVPSRRSSIQKRGFSPAALVAKALIGILQPRFGRPQSPASAGFSLSPRLVWRSIESLDQAALGQTDRRQNLVNTMSASARAVGKRIILVDDVITTGSSLFETARALESAGAEVLGFVAFAETILKNFEKTMHRAQIGSSF
jgi:predicted amidophosphoribosyltransferase